MTILSFLNAAGAALTIIAAVLVASNISAKIMVAGFSIFVVASLVWIAAGYLDDKTSLVVQNVVLLLVNAAGIWRWLPRT